MSKDFWDKNAQPWSEAIQSQLIESRKITNPAIIAEILKQRPSSVIDLGCGEGWIASQLLPKKIRYTGLDFSSQLIHRARQSHPDGIFEAVGYADLDGWKSLLVYDLAVFNFSLFDEKITPLLRTVSSLIKPKGSILIQTLHPHVALNPYQDGWRTEDFKTFPVPFSGTMRWYGRTFENWEKTFLDSGLQLQETIAPINPETQKPLSAIFSLKLK